VSTAAPLEGEMPRVIRAMLFADVAGFSKMKEEFAPRFFTLFPKSIARVLKTSGSGAQLVNTWGDGFFAVFETVAECAGFALDLIEQVGKDVDWREMGFPEINPLRVGLHAGPVFELPEDPVLGRRNFFGQHVNRAARIEPVTMPGCAFASEQFAALLIREAAERFQTDLIGVERLPKKSGMLALYRVSRA
jgi:class 3 adenylate cyclase